MAVLTRLGLHARVLDRECEGGTARVPAALPTPDERNPAYAKPHEPKQNPNP